jgi:N-acetylmuramoyl-L-alanine amidase
MLKWILMGFLIVGTCQGATLTHFRLEKNTRTHAVLSLSFNTSAPKFNTFTLKKPNRLVIDLFNTTPKHRLPFYETRISLLQQLRSGIRNHHRNLRLVFSLNIAPNKLQIHKTHTKNTLRFSLTTAQASKKKRTVRHAPIKQRVRKHRNIVIVIDPGHGGKDPGASGPHHIHEKNIVLAIAKDLKNDLDKHHGLQADLTRTGDYFVTLRGRLRLARKDHADLFIAIHADAFPNKSAHGASVFALSRHGATSEAAHWLAHSENRAVLGGAAFDTQSKTVRTVLLDLSQAITIKNSLLLGNNIKNQLAKITHLHSHRVEQAPFMVLKAPDIPSLLIETGFVSNTQEEARLNSSKTQHALARAISMGIQTYLRDHPPHHRG